MGQKITWPLSMFIPPHPLLVLSLLPVVGGLWIALSIRGNKNSVRTIAFLTTLATFVISVAIAIAFDMTIERFSIHLQFEDTLSFFRDAIVLNFGINAAALYALLFIAGVVMISILSAWEMIAINAKRNAIILLVSESVAIAALTSSSLLKYNNALPLPLAFIALTAGMLFITRRAK